jgi:hypothetical protein
MVVAAIGILLNLPANAMKVNDSACQELGEFAPHQETPTPNSVTAVIVPAAERFRPPPDKPFLLGVVRDAAGKLQPLYGASPKFASYRNFWNSGGGEQEFYAWEAQRKIEELPLSVVKTNGSRLVRTPDFARLPEPLAALLSSGKILVTQAHATTSSPERSEYSVMVATVPGENGSLGRTGYLIRKGVPVIVEADGKEFLVEVKGLGNPEGGFAYRDANNGLAIRGGLVEPEAFRENSALENERTSNPDFTHGDTARSAGYVVFDSPVGHQAYLIRLSPGSVRATFTGISDLAQDRINDAHAVRGMAELWGGFFARGYIPYSHPENIIIADGTKVFATDYADILPVGAFPGRYEGRSVVTPETAITVSLNGILQLPHYDPLTDFPVVKKAIADRLLVKQRISPSVRDAIEKAKDVTELATLLWKHVLALDHFRQQARDGFLPPVLESLTQKPPELDPAQLPEVVRENIRKEKEKLSQQKGWSEFVVKRAKQELSNAEKNQPLAQILEAKKKLAEAEQWQAGWKAALAAIEQTGGTLEGAIKLLENEAVKEFFNGRSDEMDFPGPGPGPTVVSIFGANARNLLELENHLRKQIAFLELLEGQGSADEKKIIQANVTEAKHRLEALSKLNAYTFHQRLTQEPDFLIRTAMLPYHSKHFTQNLGTNSPPQYRLLPEVQRVLERSN